MSSIRAFVMTSGLLALAAGICAGPVEADERIRVPAVTLDDKIPDEASVAAAFFPENLVETARDCRVTKCGSVIPDTSVSSTLVTFDRGKASLTVQSKAFLDRVGAVLKKRQESFENLVVEGHTDTTGSQELNRTLSKKRAESVKTYLASNFGISNVETVGRASDVLKDKDHPTAAVNRRIEFVITLSGK